MDYESMVQEAMTEAARIAKSEVPATADAAQAYGARIQALLEVAKVAAQLDAVKDARLHAMQAQVDARRSRSQTL